MARLPFKISKIKAFRAIVIMLIASIGVILIINQLN